MVVSKAPTSTTNITGFLIIVRGSNLRKESTMALRRIFESASEIGWCCRCSVIASSENLSGMHLQVLENRAQAERREERKGTHNQNGGNEQDREQRAGHGKRPGGSWSNFFLRQVSRDGQNGDMHEEAAQHHGYRSARVVPQRIAVQAAESRPIVAHHRSVSVENLR